MIAADGGSSVGSGYGGGGAGGSVWITTGALTGNGVISARGGNGSASSGEGRITAGSGGRIAVYENQRYHNIHDDECIKLLFYVNF